MSLTDLANVCQAQEIKGNPQSCVEGFCSITSLNDRCLTFVSQKSFAKLIDNDSGAFFIVKPELSDKISQGLIHDNPTQAFRLILEKFCVKSPEVTIAETAVIADDAEIGNNVTIGEYSVIKAGSIISDNCVIGSHTIIDESVLLGAGCKIGDHVSILEESQLGVGCVISDGAVIGGQGFGFSFEAGVWKPIPQIGRVIIGNNVYVGNNTCIDRGALNDTLIGNNVIIDNLVHIAHNVDIGDGSALAGAVGIAGSAKIGKSCMFGGQVGIAGHIEISDGVQINGGSRVLQSIKKAGTYSGSLNVMPSTKWNRTLIYFQKIETLFRREKKRE